MPEVLEQKILDFIEEYELIDENDHILVAFSGGADSTFLISFLNKFKELLKIKLSAIYIEHNLRGEESLQDGVFCEKFCLERNIPFLRKEINVKKFAESSKFSLEESARILRYREFDGATVLFGANKIATAHNMDDNAETSLLNLIKGKSLQAIAGIPLKRGNIIRPILCVSKSEILEYLNKNNIKFRTDSTNLQNDFQRNTLRNLVIPIIKEKINPSFSKSVFKTSLILRKEEKILRDYINGLMPKYIEESEIGFKIGLNLLDDFSTEVFERIIKQILVERFNLKVTYGEIISITKLVNAQVGKKIFLNNRVKIFRERDSIIIFKNKIKKIKAIKLKVGDSADTWLGTIGIERANREQAAINSSKKVEYIDADGVSDEFILRRWSKGDYFIPLGMKHRKKISDFLTDVKVESHIKKNYLVLTNNNKVVWLVGLRLSDEYKVKTNTRNILKLWVN